MCGIVGVFSPEPLSAGEHRRVRAGMSAMAWRGPDGSGLHSAPSVALGHVRLAILDPTAGIQPWVDEASGVALVYNGEIYNFRELRARLLGMGHVFRSRCDTEVLVRAYLAWGKDCVHWLDGMFAFALHDPAAGGLWLVRDRFGVKPLYYHHDARRLRFASTLAGLLAMGDIERKADPVALYHYLLTIRTNLGERALLDGVRVVEPGTWVWVDAEGNPPQIRTYWRLPAIAPADKGAPCWDGAVARVRERVEAAVQRQLISDVPLGGFLSGGLDSGVLTALCVARLGQDYRAYSIGYEEEAYHEWASVRAMVKYFGIGCEEIHAGTDDYWQYLQSLIRCKGLPLSTPNEVPIFQLARAFRRRFTVALTGEGADEVFGGYVGPTFCALDYDRSLGLYGGIDPAALDRGYGVRSFASRRDHYFRVNAWLQPHRARAILASDLGGPEVEESVMAWYDGFFGRIAHCSTLDAYLQLHARVNLEGLLERMDASTMAASVEGRVPFTDHTLAAEVFALPDTFKFRWSDRSGGSAWQRLNTFELAAAGAVESKALLRAAFADDIPDSVLRRPKMSFPVPFTAMFAKDLSASLRSMLAEAPAGRDWLGAGMRRVLAGGGAIDPMIGWPLLNLLFWAREFGVEL